MCSGGWGPNFENTKKLLKETLKLDVPIAGEESPIATYGSVFWFRPRRWPRCSTAGGIRISAGRCPRTVSTIERVYRLFRLPVITLPSS